MCLVLLFVTFSQNLGRKIQGIIWISCGRSKFFIIPVKYSIVLKIQFSTTFLYFNPFNIFLRYQSVQHFVNLFIFLGISPSNISSTLFEINQIKISFEMRNKDETAVATLLQYMRDQQKCTYILRRVGSNESKHLACKLFVWMREKTR